MKKILLLIIIIVGFLIFAFFTTKPIPHKLSIRKADFSQLPGWETTDVKKSLQAFKISCKVFLRQKPNKTVGSNFIDVQAKDWRPVCNAAMTLQADSNKEIKDFFQNWFTPVEFYNNKSVQGLFTGYYMPQLQGSLRKSEKYHVPLYGMPKNLVKVHLAQFDRKLKHRILSGRVKHHRVIPYYTRQEINNGAIKNIAPVIAWINSPIDRSFLEIQGSGVIELTDGTHLPINYAGENGAPYTSIAKILINKGVMTKDNASMQHIRKYLKQHPKSINSILNKNKSFVFFEKLKNGTALGTQDVGLTPGYSLAIDRKWVPFGAPIWLNTTRPIEKGDQQKTFQRLMVAQDTGGAIRGMVRGDVFWGSGKHATNIAGKMKNPGHYWVLLPQNVLKRIQDKLV